MIIQRRSFLIAGAAGLALAGCMEKGPAVMAVRADGKAGMNPGPDGSDRPVTVNILQMTGAGAFNAADYFALQNPQSAVGAELVKMDQIVLAPGGSASKSITIQPTTSTIGVTAGFRDPAGKVVRKTVAAPASDSGLIITVGPGGLSVATA